MRSPSFGRERTDMYSLCKSQSDCRAYRKWQVEWAIILNYLWFWVVDSSSTNQPKLEK